MFVKPGIYSDLNNSIETALRKYCNVISVTMQPTSSEKLTARLVRPASARGQPSRIRPLLGKAWARVASSLFQTSNFSDFVGKLPEDPDLVVLHEIYRRFGDFESFKGKKAYYASDSHIHTDRYFLYPRVQDFDYVFVGQKNDVSRFRERGCRNVTWLPHACDPSVMCGPILPQKHDVCFVGNPYSGSQREMLLKEISSRYSCFMGRRYLHDLSTVFRESKIIFNASGFAEVNARVFEATCAGRLLVTDRIDNGLEDLFKDGEHLVTYGDSDELHERISYYLQHDKEREDIAARGLEEVLSKHTISHRMRTLLETSLRLEPITRR